jgi:hypothetical protein
VTFYGQGLMNTSVVQGAVASTTGDAAPMDHLLKSLEGTIYVVLIALPGYWLAVWTIDLIGRFRLQVGGFVAETILFIILAACYHTPLRTSARGAGFVIVYGLTYLAANWGPNTTTFVMPAEAFPTPARSTAHGFSAAMGKLGATAGSYGLLSMWYGYCTSSLDSTGQPNCQLSTSLQSEVDAGIIAVMWVCAGVCAGGLIMTLLFVRETKNKTLEDVDASSKVLRHMDSVRKAKRVVAGLGPSTPNTPAATAPAPTAVVTVGADGALAAPVKVKGSASAESAASTATAAHAEAGEPSATRPAARVGEAAAAAEEGSISARAVPAEPAAPAEVLRAV